MPLVEVEYSAADVEIEKVDTLYAGFLKMEKHTLRHARFEGDPITISRELYVANEAACAVLYDPKLDAIGLIEQFRIGSMSSEHGPWSLEGVAGMMDKQESPAELVAREIEEEAGLTPEKLIPITSYYSSPGCSAEKIHLYCAIVDLSGGGGLFGLPEEGEDIRLHVLSADTVFDNMLSDRCNNAMTLMGLLWLQIHRETLRV
jgi:ADP-ribose pyrophosphatase